MMRHDTYNWRELVVPNVSFIDTKIRLKHMFIIQFDVVAKVLTNQQIGYPVNFLIVNFWSILQNWKKIQLDFKLNFNCDLIFYHLFSLITLNSLTTSKFFGLIVNCRNANRPNWRTSFLYKRVPLIA